MDPLPHLFAALLLLTATAQADLEVSTDFEGGSARVESIDQATRTIHFMPGGDPQRGWACWWYLKIDGLPAGETVTLDLAGSDLPTRNNGKDTKTPLSPVWAMPNRATFSTDRQTWSHTAPTKRTEGRMRYQIEGEGGPLWVAWGPPFTPADTDTLLAATEKALPAATSFELARTRADRPVRGVRITEATDPHPPAIWVQARQHAWESGSSWVARGFAEWLIGRDADAVWLRQHAEIYLVPIMDVDNVATGNGGKEANPQDHNRDWSDTPLYPEVAAAQRRLGTFAAEKRLAVFLELHNPSPDDGTFFFGGVPEYMPEPAREDRTRFLGLANRFINSPLKVSDKLRLTGPSYHPLWKQISGQWVSDHGNPHTVPLCLETAWNTPKSNTEGYLTVGRQLGQTCAAYLKETAPTP